MRALYLANVGNRDVWLDGQPIPAERSRAQGEAILADPAAYRGRLRAPLLETGLGWALERGTSEQPVRLVVGLFGTNQPETTPEAFRARDTASLARVLERYLPGAIKRGGGCVERVVVREVTANPSFYDQMYAFFGQALRRLGPGPDEVEACYVSPVGGVPAANFGLLLRAIERYGEKCQPLYVPENASYAVPMGVGRQMGLGLLRRLARREVEQREFRRAAALLRQAEAGDPAVGLAEHAERRLHFDFKRATRALEELVLPKADVRQRQLALELRAGLEALMRDDEQALLAELYHNLALTWQDQRWVDFLLRAFRLEEAALRFLIERDLLPTADDRRRKEFVAAIEAHPRLVDYLQRLPARASGEQVDYRRGATVPVLRALAGYLAESRPERAEYAELAAILERLERLSGLRNQSIGAHGFRGVSGEDIRAAYGAEHEPLADARRALELLGVKVGPDPFERVQRALLEALEEP